MDNMDNFRIHSEKPGSEIPAQNCYGCFRQVSETGFIDLSMGLKENDFKEGGE